MLRHPAALDVHGAFVAPVTTLSEYIWRYPRSPIPASPRMPSGHAHSPLNGSAHSDLLPGSSARLVNHGAGGELLAEGVAQLCQDGRVSL